MRRSLILFSISLRLRGFPVGMEGMPARLVNPELFQNQKPFLIIFCFFNYYFTNPNLSICCLGPQWVPVSYLCTKASCFGISDTVEYQLSMMNRWYTVLEKCSRFSQSISSQTMLLFRIFEVDNFPSIAALSLSRIMRRGEDTVGQGLIFFSLSYEFSFPFSVRGSPRGRGRPPLHTRRVFLPLTTAMAAASSSSGQPFATSGEQQRGRQLRASGRNAPPASQPLSESPATSDVAVKVEVDPAAIEEK